MPLTSTLMARITTAKRNGEKMLSQITDTVYNSESASNDNVTAS